MPTAVAAAGASSYRGQMTPAAPLLLALVAAPFAEEPPQGGRLPSGVRNDAVSAAGSELPGFEWPDGGAEGWGTSRFVRPEVVGPGESWDPLPLSSPADPAAEPLRSLLKNRLAHRFRMRDGLPVRDAYEGRSYMATPQALQRLEGEAAVNATSFEQAAGRPPEGPVERVMIQYWPTAPDGRTFPDGNRQRRAMVEVPPDIVAEAEALVAAEADERRRDAQAAQDAAAAAAARIFHVDPFPPFLPVGARQWPEAVPGGGAAPYKVVYHMHDQPTSRQIRLISLPTGDVLEQVQAYAADPAERERANRKFEAAAGRPPVHSAVKIHGGSVRVTDAAGRTIRAEMRPWLELTAEQERTILTNGNAREARRQAEWDAGAPARRAAAAANRRSVEGWAAATAMGGTPVLLLFWPLAAALLVPVNTAALCGADQLLKALAPRTPRGGRRAGGRRPRRPQTSPGELFFQYLLGAAAAALGGALLWYLAFLAGRFGIWAVGGGATAVRIGGPVVGTAAAILPTLYAVDGATVARGSSLGWTAFALLVVNLIGWWLLVVLAAIIYVLWLV